MQKKRQTSSLSGAPKASATWRAPLSGRKFVKAPSASSPANASILPRSAATTIGAGGVKPSAPAVSPVQRSSKPSASASSRSSRWSRRGTPANGRVSPQRTSGTWGTLRRMKELDGIAGADAHLGRPVPLPALALPLVRWSRVHAVSGEGVEIEFNLDDSREGAPGRLALYVGFGPPPDREWPGDDEPRSVAV